MKTARELAHAVGSYWCRRDGTWHSEACDLATTMVEADRRELVEATLKLAAEGADGFDPYVGEWLRGFKSEAIRSLLSAKDPT